MAARGAGAALLPGLPARARSGPPGGRCRLAAGRGRGYELNAPAGETLFRLRDQAVVAVRFLPGYAAADPASRGRVDRDLDQLEGVEHPNLARVLSHGTEAGVRYYFREWVRGADLASTLADGVGAAESGLVR